MATKQHSKSRKSGTHWMALSNDDLMAGVAATETWEPTRRAALAVLTAPRERLCELMKNEKTAIEFLELAEGIEGLMEHRASEDELLLAAHARLLYALNAAVSA